MTKYEWNASSERSIIAGMLAALLYELPYHPFTWWNYWWGVMAYSWFGIGLIRGIVAMFKPSNPPGEAPK